MANWFLDHWMQRLNWIGDLDQTQRAHLTGLCVTHGSHVQSGERFLTANPLHICYICGAEFHDGDIPKA